MSQLHQEEFGQPRPKKPRLDYKTPPLHFPHNQNLPPPMNPHFPMSQHRGEEFGQPLSKKPRLDYEAPPPHFPHSQNLPPPINRPQNGGLGSRLFYKTRPCAMFMKGCCWHGDNCTFAHGQSDLRKPPPNWRDQIAANSQNGMMANTSESFGQNVKTKFDETGSCPYQNSCIYALGIAERRNSRGVESCKANVGAAATLEPPTGPPISDALMSGSLPMEPQTTYMEGIEEEEEVAAARQRWPKKMNGIYGDWPSYLMLRG